MRTTNAIILVKRVVSVNTRTRKLVSEPVNGASRRSECGKASVSNAERCGATEWPVKNALICD